MGQSVQISQTRLPYHPGLEKMGVEKSQWRLLCESVFPGAKSIEGIALAVRYCQQRNLDVFKKPVHVVPVWNSKLQKEVELVWPGIAEYRTTASRTKTYAGCDKTEYGPLVETAFKGSYYDSYNKKDVNLEKTIKHHKWMRVTVYKVVAGTRCPFPGPKVFFDEIYSRVRHNVAVPNDRWCQSPNGMHEKCAEVAALRKAFPEELGSEYTAEEMEGKIVDITPSNVLENVSPEDVSNDVNDHIEALELEDSGIDWHDVLENMKIGVQSCSTIKEFDVFMKENSEEINEMGSNLSEDDKRDWLNFILEKRPSQ